MHELAVTQAIVEQVRAFAAAPAVVRDVHVDIGRLEHLDGDVMRTAWQAMTEETEMAGATLHLRGEPVALRCRACDHRYEPLEAGVYRCPSCGAARPEVLRGSGVVLRRIEIDEPDPGQGAS